MWAAPLLCLPALQHLLDDEDGHQDLEGDGGQVEEELDMGEVLDHQKERGSGDETQVKTDVFGELHGERRLLDRIALGLIAQGKRESQQGSDFGLSARSGT